MAVLIVLMAFVSQPSQASSVSSAREWNDPPARLLADRYGLGNDEAHRRITQESTVASLQRELSAGLGDGYVGLRAVHAEGGRIDVFSPRSRSDVEDIIASHEHAGLAVEYVPVEFSRTDLRDDHLRVRARASAHAGFSGTHVTWFDGDVPRIVVRFTPDSEPNSAARSQILAASELVPVLIVSGAPVRQDSLACSSRNWCSQPLRGGVRIYADGICTSGFTATRGSAYLYVTAGHCVDDIGVGGTVEQRDNGGTRRRVGPVWAWRDQSDVDAAIIHVDGSEIDQIENIVYYTDNAQALRITSMATGSDAWPGRTLCSAGQTSGLRCGQVIDSFADAGDSPPARLGMLLTDICREGGDSGAPVFSPNGGAGIAFAIHSGSSSDNDCPTTEDAWHTWVFIADGWLDFDLRTG